MINSVDLSHTVVAPIRDRCTVMMCIVDFGTCVIFAFCFLVRGVLCGTCRRHRAVGHTLRWGAPWIMICELSSASILIRFPSEISRFLAFCTRAICRKSCCTLSGGEIIINTDLINIHACMMLYSLTLMAAIVISSLFRAFVVAANGCSLALQLFSFEHTISCRT